MTRVKPPILAYGLAGLIIVADQLSKVLMLERVFPAACPGFEATPLTQAFCSIDVAPVFNLTLVWNRGVSFGLFRSPDGQELIRWMLAAFSAIVAIALIVWVRKARRLWGAAGVGLIIGGALGNLVDRVRFGAVVDFLDFSALYFPWVFNIADSAISVGVALLLIETMIVGENDHTPS
jgi:signal peptidase II